MLNGHARLLAIALTVALGTGIAAADQRDRPSKGGHGRMSENQAAAQAQKRYGGRVLDVRPLPPNGGGDGYRVKLLDHGEVRSVTIPAAPDENRGRARSGR